MRTVNKRNESRTISFYKSLWGQDFLNWIK